MTEEYRTPAEEKIDFAKWILREHAGIDIDELQKRISDQQKFISAQGDAIIGLARDLAKATGSIPAPEPTVAMKKCAGPCGLKKPQTPENFIVRADTNKQMNLCRDCYNAKRRAQHAKRKEKANG